jgi:argininosuccinate lyase
MPFAPAYVAYVLNENFEDAKELFLSPLLAVEYAHLVMLAECGIVSGRDAHTLREALDEIAARDLGALKFDGTSEDLFFRVDRLVAEICGEDVAGRLHTARSRNDIDVTMYRMRQREFVLGLFGATLSLRRVLLGLADRHRDTIFAAHTHAQPAQPTTLAHYLHAVIEQLERDGVRLRAAFETTNWNPLGACAITGTGFSIDRRITTDLLGFAAPTGNTYGSIAAVDYLLENVAAAAVAMAGFGRFVQDLLLWSMAEFGYLHLGDGFVQGSSIMPQKRNPVALEHVRGIASKALGQATAILTSVHNTPFGDIVDTEDDLQPLVFSMFRDAARSVALAAAALETAEFDVTRLGARAEEGGITMTELADTLVREHGLAFSTAHAIACRVMESLRSDPEAPLSDVVLAASTALAGVPIRYSEERLAEVLSPQHFVDVRHTPGGPAGSETERALAESGRHLEGDQRWATATRDALEAAERRRRERSARL